VWLPWPGWAEGTGGLPDGMTADVWSGGGELPDSADEVEVVVMPFGVPESRLPVLAKLPSIRLIQLLSAGAERMIPHVPPGVTLCNARGAHDPAVAEWIMAAILAQVRLLPKFLSEQQAETWASGQSESLGGQTVLIVGYGSIGEAVERLLVPFGVRIERVARNARSGVSGIDDLPALLVNAARGAIVETGALLAELTRGRLRAALDVTDPEPLPAGHPLWSAPGVLLTPHVAGLTPNAFLRVEAIVRDQLARYASGEPLHNVIGARGY